MELRNELKDLSKKIIRNGKENMIAVVSLTVFLGIGFFAVLWFFRSYTVDSCLRTLEQETKEVQENIHLQISFAQSRLEMLGDIIEKEEDITSEQVIQILKSDTGIGLVSRLGIILPDDRVLNQDGTLSEPVNGITFKALNEKRTFITNMEPDNLNADKFVLFFNIPLKKEGQTEGILFGVIEPQVLSDYFKVDIFDGNADIFIVDTQNMEFIMDTLHGQGESDAFEGHKIKRGYSEEQVAQDFADGKGGITAYFSRSLKEYLYTAYEPAEINDWFVMLTVPESIVFKETAYIEKVLFCLGLYEVIILVAYFLWDIKRTQREIHAKEKLATIDLLTNLKNRNAYEQALARYEEDTPAGLSCVYADVNGLHELNNSQGHAAGDKMLQIVAKVFVEYFGQEHVYRIGGDEFLIFVEANLDKVSEKALAAKEKVIEAGYHVSVGTASGGNVASVVKEAELRMYEDKKQYYMSRGDRRKMR